MGIKFDINLEQAMELLSLKTGFTETEFKFNYKKIIMGIHPDTLGNINPLARKVLENEVSRVNIAKAVIESFLKGEYSHYNINKNSSYYNRESSSNNTHEQQKEEREHQQQKRRVREYQQRERVTRAKKYLHDIDVAVASINMDNINEFISLTKKKVIVTSDKGIKSATKFTKWCNARIAEKKRW